MPKPKFNKKRVLNEIREIFPMANIVSYKKMKGGLVSPTYKVKIKKPSTFLAVKIYKRKNYQLIEKNRKIFEYLSKNNLPAPRIYSNKLFISQGILIMQYINGNNALDLYNNSSLKIKRNILLNSGRILKKIHKLKIPEFWIHHKHEIKNGKEWKKWTRKRVLKYLKFSTNHLDTKHHLFLKEKLKQFLKTLNYDIEFVPMHWDYHLANILVNNKGNVIAIIDFDNSFKGHNLADIGQTQYWLRFKSKDYDNFKYFLKGYSKKIGKKEQILIEGYFLLHLIAVTRSIWKKKRLNWIIKEHSKILNELISNNRK